MPTLAERLVPDALWHRVAPLLPPPPPRSHGGRRRTIPDRACFAAVVFMARTSTPWEFLPARELSCGSASTAYRRFTAWTRAGVFDRLTLVLLDELGEAGRIDWSRISVDTVSLRAIKTGGPHRRKPDRPSKARQQAPPRRRPRRHPAGRAADRRQPARLHPVRSPH
jgi:transposase